jgi:polar amino acid transport system substrate-binding protein
LAETHEPWIWVLRAGLFTLAGLIAGFSVDAFRDHLVRLAQLHEETIRAFIKTVDAKSPYTTGHSERVAQFAVMIGEEMGLPPDEIEDLRMAALIHDIGKLWMPEDTLNNPDSLTDDEWEVIRIHPLRSEEFIANVREFQRCRAAVRHHQEHFDGSGYPDGLHGRQIPMHARILAVADVYEAMTAARPHRRMLSTDEALAEIRRHAGTKFDPYVAEAMVRVGSSAPESMWHGNMELAQSG